MQSFCRLGIGYYILELYSKRYPLLITNFLNIPAGDVETNSFLLEGPAPFAVKPAIQTRYLVIGFKWCNVECVTDAFTVIIFFFKTGKRELSSL